MGSKLVKKGGVRPKREVKSTRPKEKKITKKVEEPKEEEFELPSDSSSESESENENEDEFTGFDDDDEEKEITVNIVDESNDDEDDEKEEETAGGLEGFESSDDEEEQDKKDEKQKEEDKQVKKSESHEVKALPKADKKSTKQSKTKKGVIYIGRLPEGFEERELSKYFNQFGDITNVKLPRSKKTGKSKHYGFIEFANKDDAKVAQETMNNYLLLNHQLKVNIVDEEFKSSKKFKKNYFKVSKLKKDVKSLNENVEKKRKQRKEALKAAGIDI